MQIQTIYNKGQTKVVREGMNDNWTVVLLR